MLTKLPYIPFLILICFTYCSFGQNKGGEVDPGKTIVIMRENNLEGDFSFTEDWSYPEGVYVNRHGQLSCDGFCPMEIDAMKDSTGRIYEDSLTSFYAVVDTTRYYHNIVAQGAMYEWAGSNQMEFSRGEEGVLLGRSMCSAATHTSINIRIEGDSVNAWLEYIGIIDGEPYSFPLKDGWIQIDKKLYKKNIIKATFHFDFENHLEALVPLDCEGMIYSKLP